MLKYIFIPILIAITTTVTAQTGKISGQVTVAEKSTPYVTMYVVEVSRGAVTNEHGKYLLDNLPFGTYTIIASYVGYTKVSKSITISPNQQDLTLLLSQT
jgi:hypothetical protein